MKLDQVSSLKQNLKFRYRKYQIPPLDWLSQIHPLQILATCFPKTHLNVILQSLSSNPIVRPNHWWKVSVSA
jgi:hypothetical protein